MTDEDKYHRRNFSANYKNSTYLKGILKGAPRCGICRARLNLKSVSVDHIRRREDGGSDTSENTQLAHPYCNSGYKESLHAAKLRTQS
ncbi:MAG: HNH endonuclease [Streptosporangiaceae bacterium]